MANPLAANSLPPNLLTMLSELQRPWEFRYMPSVRMEAEETFELHPFTPETRTTPLGNWVRNLVGRSRRNIIAIR